MIQMRGRSAVKAIYFDSPLIGPIQSYSSWPVPEPLLLNIKHCMLFWLEIKKDINASIKESLQPVGGKQTS